MRRLRGTGLAIMILAGMSGCAGVQRHLSWPSNEVSQADDAEAPRLGWWKRPAPERPFASDPGPTAPETVQNGSVVIGADSGRDIWSAERPDGLARYFPNTIRTWNRFTSRFKGDGTEHFDEVPVQASKAAESERTALNGAGRDRQVKTVRMTEDREKSDQANAGQKKPASSGEGGILLQVEGEQAQLASATPVPVFYEPTAAGRPRPITYADLARDPAAGGAFTEDENIRPAAASRAEADAAPVMMVVAINDSASESPTVAAAGSEIAAGSSATDSQVDKAETPATGATQPSGSPSDPSPRSVRTTSTDGSATAAIRRKLSDIRTKATEQPAEASPATGVSTPGPTPSGGSEPVARLASNADVPPSAGVAPPAPETSTPAAAKPVAVSPESDQSPSPSPSPSPQGLLPAEHNHLLFGWLCPFKKKPHSLLASSQLPAPAYPTSYESCKSPSGAKCELPMASSQAEGCAEAHSPKKPCFLKTWLHTSAQASLEEPAALPQIPPVTAAPAPKKPCFLKTMFHHHDASDVTATPQASPQGSVVATSATKKACFLKVWMHKFDHQPNAGCTCAGCAEGGSHCCCVSQKGCGFNHFRVHATGQSAVPSAPTPAGQSAANDSSPAKSKTGLAEAGYSSKADYSSKTGLAEAGYSSKTGLAEAGYSKRQSAANDSGREKGELLRTGSRGAEADDVAEKRKLESSAGLSASSNDLDKASEG